MTQADRLDGFVLLGSFDKIVSGMLIAVARLDISAILVIEVSADGGAYSTSGGK